MSNWKHFQATEIDVTQELKLVLGKIENTVRKGERENVGYQQHLLFLQYFQNDSLNGSINLLPHNAAFWHNKDI